MENLTLSASAEDKNKRLDAFIAENAGGLTRSTAQRLIETKSVTVDGKTPAKSYKLRGGEKIKITLPEPEESGVAAQDIPLDVVYEDADVIAVDKPTGMVVDRTSSNWTRTITLNKGTRDGIAVKNCVINEEGCVVGTVTDVGVNWCTVLTCVDTDFEMGARVFRTQEAAVAQGDFNLMGENRLRLEYISENGDIINGDLVVSSGLGGYYPPGLVIGSVTSVQTDASGSADYAVVSPAVDFDTLTEVFVVTAFDVVE